MKSKNTHIGILGYGEVGKAIAKFYASPKIKDIRRDDGLEGVEVLHICIPWSKHFISIAKKQILASRPKLVIVHSTVPPGTTKKLNNALSAKVRHVVHSPIRGIHPHLYKGVQTFVKYVGAENKATGELAAKHLRSVGMKPKVVTPAITTELGKLLSTTYYGVCIAWHGEMQNMCKRFGVDFDKAFRDFNESYNEGYAKLGRKDVVRPTLYPPEKGIGGHCVIPNAEILKEFFNSKALDLVLEYKPKSKKRK